MSKAGEIRAWIRANGTGSATGYCNAHGITEPKQRQKVGFHFNVMAREGMLKRVNDKRPLMYRLDREPMSLEDRARLATQKRTQAQQARRSEAERRRAQARNEAEEKRAQARAQLMAKLATGNAQQVAQEAPAETVEQFLARGGNIERLSITHPWTYGVRGHRAANQATWNAREAA